MLLKAGATIFGGPVAANPALNSGPLPNYVELSFREMFKAAAVYKVAKPPAGSDLPKCIWGFSEFPRIATPELR